MHYPKVEEAKCVQLRSEVIQKILEAKDEHCKAVEMSESFVHPTDIKMLCAVFKEVFSNAIVLSWLLCIPLANCRSHCSLIAQQAPSSNV